MQRTASAPISSPSLITETPLLPRQHSLLRSNVMTPSSFETIKETPPAASITMLQERRTVPTPSIGTGLILNYSTGIETMLGKKKKKKKDPANRKKSKETSIQLVPENERIFKDLTFYYVPPDDIALLRRFRIRKAMEFGATWAGKDWNPSITHIVVDKTLTYKDVMTFLKLDALPPNIIMVNDDYPVDCTQYKFLLDPKQSRYAVSGQDGTVEKEHPAMLSQGPDQSHEVTFLKPRNKKRTMSHSEDESTQTSPQGVKHPRISGNTTQGILLEHDRENANPDVVESPVETSRSDNEVPQRQESAWPGDALDEMIKVARDMEHLPLNDEDDDLDDERTSSGDDPEDSGSDDEARRVPSRSALQAKRKRTYTGPFTQENFTCMTGGTGITPESNPNARTIEVLQEMTDYYIRTKDHWRQTAYRKVMSTLKRQTTKISTYEEAIVLPTIGHRLALKIEEIVLTNRLRILESAKLEGNDHVLQTFMKIYGVGISQGWKWVQQGYKTLEDLKKHVHLTDSQKLGIEHYDDFLTCIPRVEVTALGEIVKAAAAHLDPDVQVIIGGSYRRGAATSGDIDCLLTKPGTSASRDLLPFVIALVGRLTATGFLVAALAALSEAGSASKWHGCCLLPGSSVWRRIDLLLVPETELGAALIYFTGDDIFNRSIRLLSSRKGWMLNQRGLFKDVMRGPGRLKLNEGTLVEGADEKKIFAHLGVPWRPPEQRICH